MLRDKSAIKFEWDTGNIGKNKKHNVNDKECEEIFFDRNKRTFKDKLHSGNKERFRIIGKTNQGRLLFIVFTKRAGKIRIISARDISKKEVYLYEEKTDIT
jgi:hypothetical protein